MCIEQVFHTDNSDGYSNTHVHTHTRICLERVGLLIKRSKINLLDFKVFSKMEKFRFSAKNNLSNKRKILRGQLKVNSLKYSNNVPVKKHQVFVYQLLARLSVYYGSSSMER